MRTLRTVPLLFAAALLLGAGRAAAQDAQATTPAAMAKRVYGLLSTQKALQGGALLWGGENYAMLEKGYEICDAYNGACYVVRGKPDSPPQVLAFYEITPGQLGVTELKYPSYWKGRSQDAVHYFMDHGARMNGVFSLVDAKSRSLFDARGLLTAAGGAVYESLLEGRTARWGEPGSMTPEKEPYGDPKEAKAKIATLMRKMFFEVQQDDYDCLHDKFKFSDDEMSTAYVYDGPRLRIFLHDDMEGTYHSMLEIYHKKGECKAGGTTITH